MPKGKTRGILSHYCTVSVRGDICDEPQTTVKGNLYRTTFSLLVSAPGCPVEFYKIVHFSKDGDLPRRLFSKGETLEIEGRLHIFSFTDPSGIRRQDVQIIPERVFNLDRWFAHKYAHKGDPEAFEE